jgi:hypothetical protein
MQHLEDSGTPVLYIGRTVLTGIFFVLFFFCAFAKLRNVTLSIVMSVCPSACVHGTTMLHLVAFLLNLIFGYFFFFVVKLDVHEFVHRDSVINVTNKMQLYRLIYYS